MVWRAYDAVCPVVWHWFMSSEHRTRTCTFVATVFLHLVGFWTDFLSSLLLWLCTWSLWYESRFCTIFSIVYFQHCMRKKLGVSFRFENWSDAYLSVTVKFGNIIISARDTGESSMQGQVWQHLFLESSWGNIKDSKHHKSKSINWKSWFENQDLKIIAL